MAVCYEMGLPSRVQGSSLQFRSGSALRPFWPFVDFIGCCNFYHTFVKDYARYAAPLTELLKVGREAGRAGSKVRVLWTDECDEAFVQLKAALCEVATLHVPKFDRPFYLRTDASKYAVGAVLEQQDLETGAHYPLAFWSRKLSPRQMQWSPREQETYAIICALKNYQSWVGTNRVEVLKDHRSLEYWSTEHVKTVSGPAGWRARWHEFLSLFDLHVAYLPGNYNTVADALSRWAYLASEACLSTNIHETEQDRGLVIEWDAEERQLIKRHCLLKRYGVLHPYPLNSLWRSSPGQIRNFPADATAS